MLKVPSLKRFWPIYAVFQDRPDRGYLICLKNMFKKDLKYEKGQKCLMPDKKRLTRVYAQ